jgi:signal transduction histidine kinase
MEWQYTLFLVLAPLSAGTSVAVLLLARRYRASASSDTSALAWLVASVVGWLVLNTAELVAPSAAATLFWARLSYLFIASTPLAWLAFALQYTGLQRWMVPARFAWACVVPVVTFLLAVTDPLHHLLWRTYEFLPVGNLLAMRVVDYGPWFWIFAAYAYALVLLGAFLIGRQYFTSFRPYRRQSAWVVAGALIPVAANLVYLSRLVPGLTKDFTSVSFAFASMAFVVGIFRYRLFDLKPIAREVVVDSMRDPMLTLDARGRIVDLNPAACSLVARLRNTASARGLVGQPVAQVLAPWPALVDRLHNGTAAPADLSVDLAGTQRHYELQLSSLAGQAGQPAGRLLFLRDITPRKQVEEQLRHYALELEAQNQELDAFTYAVAHDLKDPLATLIGYSDYLHDNLQRIPGDELLDCLEVLRDTGHMMINIVDQLLLLARVRRHTTVEVEVLDLEAMLCRVQERLAQLVAATGAQILLPDRWPEVESYAPWVEEVWVNYLSNALRYGGRPEGGIPPRVEVGYGPHPGLQQAGAPAGDPGLPVCFWVRDNGPGLTEREQSQLFVEFTRLVRSRPGGSGLGLAIVRRIVEKLGGEVGVQSEPGQGSLFWFTLPRQRGKE